MLWCANKRSPKGLKAFVPSKPANTLGWALRKGRLFPGCCQLARLGLRGVSTHAQGLLSQAHRGNWVTVEGTEGHISYDSGTLPGTPLGTSCSMV